MCIQFTVVHGLDMLSVSREDDSVTTLAVLSLKEALKMVKKHCDTGGSLVDLDKMVVWGLEKLSFLGK